jgi:uncharacterized membrane protein
MRQNAYVIAAGSRGTVAEASLALRGSGKDLAMQIHARMFAVAILAVAGAQPAFSQAGSGDFAAVRHIVSARCRFCHTAIPQEDGLNAGSQPPKGVKFDTTDDIRKLAPLIALQAVKSKRMPPDNATHMSDEERATLGKWIEAGANVP